MRISDWSSDVCSSDLFVDQQRAAAGMHAAPVGTAMTLACRQRQRERPQRGEVGAGAQIECTEDRTHAGLLVPAIAGGGAPCAETKNPRRARVSGRLWPDLLLVACPVARPRIARTIIRTAIIAVEGERKSGVWGKRGSGR